jgi:hypothetical protein
MQFGCNRITSHIAIEYCDESGSHYVDVPDCPGLKIKSDSPWQTIPYEKIKGAVEDWFDEHNCSGMPPVQPNTTIPVNSAGNRIRRIHVVTIRTTTFA